MENRIEHGVMCKNVSGGAKKNCFFQGCKSDSRYSCVKFLPFPKACLKVRQKWIKADSDHLKVCSVCEKCTKWTTICRKPNDKFLMDISKIDRWIYICVLHFVEECPSEKFPNPFPRDVVKVLRIAKGIDKKRKLEEGREIYSAPKKVAQMQCSNNSILQTTQIQNSEYTDCSASNVHRIQKAIPSTLLQSVPNGQQLMSHEWQTDSDSTQQYSKNRNDKGVQTEWQYSEVEILMQQIKILQEEKNDLLKKVESLERNLAKKDGAGECFSSFVESLKKDDKKCLYYTNLVFPKLNILWNFLKPMGAFEYWGAKRKVKAPNKRKLNFFEEIVLTLVRLRSGVLLRDLKYRFNMSEGYISQICTTMVQHMYNKFNVLRPSMFASRAKIKENLPASFNRLKNIRVIIDCTEFYCESPSNFEAQGNAYSQYKAHTTYKVLLGCTPNGSVSFVSDLFEGSISDRELVKQSKLIDLLEEGDLVLADRGFTIQDLTDQKRVALNIPPFLKGRNKLTAEEEIATKNIAKERIYVEHVVGKLKQFRLLKKILPLNMKGILSQMVFVCACLINFQEPIVAPTK